MELRFDQEPVIVAIAGSNGAGKTTFFETFIRPAALRFVNADAIARELSLDPYTAAALAAQVRKELLARGESFVFETVLSDATGEKVAFLRTAADQGYNVVLCFIGLDSAKRSDDRVAMRVSQGGHDVPREKIVARYPRTLQNLARALRQLPSVEIFDNTDLADPFRWIARYRDGRMEKAVKPLPAWFSRVIRSRP